LAIVLIAPAAQAEETEGYGFAAAAQELSQLFWPAETANASGWASREEVLKFERFSLRFLAAIALFSAQPRQNCANRTVSAAEERHQQFRAVHLRGLLAVPERARVE
jgi:hypothetical protein